jgi:hypothetical protein
MPFSFGFFQLDHSGTEQIADCSEDVVSVNNETLAIKFLLLSVCLVLKLFAGLCFLSLN